MKQKAFLRKVSFVLFLLIATLFNLYSQEYETEKQKIKKLYYDMADALINKNWEQYQSFFYQDTSLNVLHPAQSDWAMGWHAVESRYKPLFNPDVDMNAEVETDTFKVFIAPDGEFAWALVDQKLKMGGQSFQSWLVVIYKKVDGKWRINMAIDADLPPKQ